AALAGNITQNDCLIVPIFDARRENVYSGVYENQDGQLQTVLADQHVPLTEWLLQLATLKKPICFLGKDLKKFQDKIMSILPEAIFPENPILHQLQGSVLL